MSEFQIQQAEGSQNISNSDTDALMWYVVHTHPKQEDRANSNLKTLGLETLTPRFRLRKYNQYTGKLSQAVKPLFPGYIFTRFKFSEAYHRVRFTRGVHSLVCFNNRPTPVDDEIIDLVRSRVGDDGYVTAFEGLKAGDEVRINEGRFQNLCGVFEREMQDADRVQILLSTVSFQAHVVVDRALVNKVSPKQRSASLGFAYSC